MYQTRASTEREVPLTQRRKDGGPGTQQTTRLDRLRGEGRSQGSPENTQRSVSPTLGSHLDLACADRNVRPPFVPSCPYRPPWPASPDLKRPLSPTPYSVQHALAEATGGS